MQHSMIQDFSPASMTPFPNEFLLAAWAKQVCERYLMPLSMPHQPFKADGMMQQLSFMDSSLSVPFPFPSPINSKMMNYVGGTNMAHGSRSTHNNKFNPKQLRGLRKTSRFRGVYWNTAAGKWRARIWVNGKSVHLGNFLSELDAARAFDEYAIREGRLNAVNRYD